MEHHQLFAASIARKQVNALGKQILLEIVQQYISLDNLRVAAFCQLSRLQSR